MTEITIDQVEYDEMQAALSAIEDMELHLAGTRTRIQLLEDDKQAMRDEITEQAQQIAALEAERDAVIAKVLTIDNDPSNWDDPVNGVTSLCAIIQDYRNEWREMSQKAKRTNYDGIVYVTPETSTAITEMHTVISELMHLLGSMRTLAETGAGDDAPEAREARNVYRRALDLTGAPPASGYSYGGLDPLSAPVATNEDLANGRYLVSVYTQRAETAATDSAEQTE